MADAWKGNAREAAWWALHDALPAGWRIGELTFDPASGQYVLAAMSPRPPGRGRPPGRVLVARGVDELAAVRALAERLRSPPWCRDPAFTRRAPGAQSVDGWYKGSGG